MGLPGEVGGRGHPAGRRLGAAQRAARHLVVTVLKANAIFPRKLLMICPVSPYPFLRLFYRLSGHYGKPRMVLPKKPDE